MPDSRRLNPPKTYSHRTLCPGCKGPVSLEEIRVAGTFRCPDCGQLLRVTTRYQRGFALVNIFLALLIVVLLTREMWWAFCLFIPIAVVVMMPMTVIAKFVVPPRLERGASTYSGSLGLH
jgi:uncharacterized paraquat-inducible protein A